MTLVIALALIGVGSALWSEHLLIDGIVQTGDVDVVMSLESVVENDHGKDVAACDATFHELDNGLSVVIGGAYPSYECWVEFDVHSAGTVPVHIYHPTWTLLPPPEAVTFSLVNCYEEDTQLHQFDEAYCTLYIHVEQEAAQNELYEFAGFIDARQFNEPRDAIIDADGVASRFSGSGDPAFVEVVDQSPLTTFPTGGYVEGLDWFDTDGTCTWTFGDDLHAEGSAHPTAIRDGWHDDGRDPLVLDWDNSLDTDPAIEQVDVDLETGTAFTGCAGPDPLVKFFDTSGNGYWDAGEDLVLDLNNNGVFDG